MSPNKWNVTIVSEPDFEKLVAELYVNDVFVALLDQEIGPKAIFVNFPGTEGAPGLRVPLVELLAQLQAAGEDLAR